MPSAAAAARRRTLGLDVRGGPDVDGFGELIERLFVRSARALQHVERVVRPVDDRELGAAPESLTSGSGFWALSGRGERLLFWATVVLCLLFSADVLWRSTAVPVAIGDEVISNDIEPVSPSAKKLAYASNPLTHSIVFILILDFLERFL